MKIQRITAKLESGRDVVIAALGDSLTAGWMVNKGYTDYLKEMLSSKYKKSGIDIINCGVSGDTADGGLERIRYCGHNKTPDLFIVEFGLNDAFMNHSVSRFKKNIKLIAAGIKELYKSEIILITSVPLADEEENEIMNGFYRSIEEAAAEEKIYFAAPHELFKLKMKQGISRSELFLSDMIHPSSEGYKLIAESIVEML